jgi:tetratricopeptide (TPR) repeat protein
MHYNIGNGYNVLGNLAKAISHYQFSLDLYPENPECLKNYGTILSQLGRKQEAVELFERALQINPRHSQSLFSLAVLQIREQQNFERGIELLSRISIRNATPRLSRLLLEWRAFANIKLKRFQEAIVDLEDVSIEKEDSWHKNNLGACYRAIARISDQWKIKALAYWRGHLKANVDDAEAWYEMGELNYGLGHATGEGAYFLDSIECYRNAVDRKIDASSGVLWDHLGHALSRVGKTSESTIAFRNARLWNPEEYTYCLVQQLVASSLFAEALPPRRFISRAS